MNKKVLFVIVEPFVIDDFDGTVVVLKWSDTHVIVVNACEVCNGGVLVGDLLNFANIFKFGGYNVFLELCEEGRLKITYVGI